jgi:type II secretory pathway component PulK
MRIRSGEEGVILIALLWILTALAVIAMSFSRESFVEVAAARNLRDTAVGYYAARGGIAFTAFQLIQRRLYPPVRQLELPGPPDPLDLGIVRGTSGDGDYEVEIQDESGKINVNFVMEEQLKALMEALGIGSPDADVIVDSIMDWKDADNLRRDNGAEDDYYQTLNPPYKAKNGRIDTVEELLLLRGVSKEYFYGRTQKMPDGSLVHRPGLWNCFTVYSTTNRVNVNFAPLEVLLSVPGMPPQTAQLIYERRKTKPFVSIDEINRALPVNLGATTLPYLSTDLTNVYSLTAQGRRRNSKATRLVRAVVFLDPREPGGYRVIYWNDNVPGY